MFNTRALSVAQRHSFSHRSKIEHYNCTVSPLLCFTFCQGTSPYSKSHSRIAVDLQLLWVRLSAMAFSWHLKSIVENCCSGVFNTLEMKLEAEMTCWHAQLQPPYVVFILGMEFFFFQVENKIFTQVLVTHAISERKDIWPNW